MPPAAASSITMPPAPRSPRSPRHPEHRPRHPEHHPAPPDPSGGVFHSPDILKIGVVTILKINVAQHRYHQRRGRLLPAYVCQRDGISRGRRICQAVPGGGLDERIGQLLIDTLTPLTVEAALTVAAELQHRADEAGALRAAHAGRARYHADLARRRYLAAGPASRLVADTLEAGWNTALRALNDAQAACDKAREQHDGTLTPARKDRISQLVTDLPGIWHDPATPMRERKRIARLLLTDVTV